MRGKKKKIFRKFLRKFFSDGEKNILRKERFSWKALFNNIKKCDIKRNINQCEIKKKKKKKKKYADLSLFSSLYSKLCTHVRADILCAWRERERERASSKIGPTATACSLHVKRIQWTVNCALILIAAFIRLVITKATRVLPCFTLSRYILFAHDCSRCVKSRFISPRIQG